MAMSSVPLRLPPIELRFMRESDERFLSTAKELARILEQRGLRYDSSLIDIGSGYGRLVSGCSMKFISRASMKALMSSHIMSGGVRKQSPRASPTFASLTLMS
jgi:hypothetical protein